MPSENLKKVEVKIPPKITFIRVTDLYNAYRAVSFFLEKDNDENIGPYKASLILSVDHNNVTVGCGHDVYWTNEKKNSITVYGPGQE